MSEECVYCRSCGASDKPVNGKCYHCGSIEIQDYPDDPEDIQWLIDDEDQNDQEPCEIWGHDWSEPDSNGTRFCERCDETFEP
jgi:hypothetical protein